MKLILDQNLSWKLLAGIRRRFPGSKHVSNAGLSEASDREIWDHAREFGFAICSKDNDFRQLSFLHGAPPKVIWLDIGNRSTEEIEAILAREEKVLERFAGSDEAILVIHALDHH